MKIPKDGGGDTNVSLFCSESLYDKPDLSSLEGAYDVYSDEDSKDGNSDPLGMELHHYKPVGLSQSLMESGSDEAHWRLGNSMHTHHTHTRTHTH